MKEYTQHKMGDHSDDPSDTRPCDCDKPKSGITQISFPNNTEFENQSIYKIGKGCDEINCIFKNGEMALICWFEIIKDGKKIAEIKESVCNIYF